MTCMLVDDQILQNGKIGALIDAAGPEAVSLWLGVGTACSGSNNGGVITPSLVSLVARTWAIKSTDRIVAALVDTRLWHDRRTARRCESCAAHLDEEKLTLPADGFLFHDWGQQQFNAAVAKDPIARRNHNRGKELSRMPELVRAIRDRDGDWCRYCGTVVDFNARRGPNSGTYDHVDPRGANELENVVVACRRCNGEKKDRTPQEAGIELRPAPDRHTGELP